MLKQIVVKICFILLSSMLIISCGGDSSTATKKDEPGKIDSTPPPGLALAKISGYMDTLYIESKTFEDLPKKRMSLKYFINPEGGLTLLGWQTKTDINNDVYDQAGTLLLKNGHQSPESPYGAGSFLGGVVLQRGEIASIKSSIKNPPPGLKVTTVIFAPEREKDVSGNYTGHFIYNILLSDYIPAAALKDSAASLAPKILIRSGVSANPSPPRNS